MINCEELDKLAANMNEELKFKLMIDLYKCETF
jgi:hypothetical protein